MKPYPIAGELPGVLAHKTLGTLWDWAVDHDYHMDYDALAAAWLAALENYLSYLLEEPTTVIDSNPMFRAEFDRQLCERDKTPQEHPAEHRSVTP
jgi:hypothetical protein